MTVKGINFNNSNKQSAAILASDESILSSSPYKHNGSNNSLNRDSNLNHYKINQVRSIIQKLKCCKETEEEWRERGRPTQLMLIPHEPDDRDQLKSHLSDCHLHITVKAFDNVSGGDNNNDHNYIQHCTAYNIYRKSWQ